MSDLLNGCWAKLDRAEETLQNLDSEFASFIERDPKPFDIVGKHNGAEYQFIVRGDPILPPRFSVLIGEIIHHLRSTLDHLIWALVIRNSRSPDRNNQFPICTTKEKFEDVCQNGMLKGVSGRATKIIQELQPFNNATPKDTIFYVLHEYDIVDKHRLLLVTATVAQMGQEIEVAVNQNKPTDIGPPMKTPSIIAFGAPGPWSIKNDGDILWTVSFGEPAPHVKIKVKFNSFLAFEKCGLVPLQPVLPTLKNFCIATRNAVEALKGEF